MEDNKSESITIKKEALWKYATFILAAVLIVGAIVFFVNSDGNSGKAVNTGSGTGSANGNVVVSADDDAVLGDADAPVEIIEFSDYQCPYCGKFWSETLPQIEKDYIQTGKAKLVFRDFPLESIHPMAMPAALAAECVKDKGGDDAYYKYHDKLFANQASLSNDNLKKWAKELGYDISSCLDSKKFESEVRNDLADGSAAGVQGTPSFIINGQMISGAQPYSVFKQIIDAQLSA